MTGTLTTGLSEIFTATNNGDFVLTLSNRNEVSTLVKVNENIYDDVTLAPSDTEEDNVRVIKLYLIQGDVISAQASIADEVRYTITD